MSNPTRLRLAATVASKPVRSGATTVQPQIDRVELVPLHRELTPRDQLAVPGEDLGREGGGVRGRHRVEVLVGRGADERGELGAPDRPRSRESTTPSSNSVSVFTNSSRTSAALLVFHAAGPVARESPIVST